MITEEECVGYGKCMTESPIWMLNPPHPKGNQSEAGQYGSGNLGHNITEIKLGLLSV